MSPFLDRDERPGWGYVLEFGIIPAMRRAGWGTAMYEHVTALMREEGATQVWLTSDPGAESFWRRLGFHETGETEHGQKSWLEPCERRPDVICTNIDK